MLPVSLRSFDVNLRRPNPLGINNWLGHIPFAFDLVSSVEPRLLVELGTHYGESYFGLCQAVDEGSFDCSCYAVDTWQGDKHAGFYGPEVLANVRTYNAKTYSRFSTLLQMTFDEALSRFADQSICLLHIDGLHTYEASRHDFTAWLPKVRPGGVILLHDTAPRHGDFGVWRLWEEVAQRFPSFVFHHSNGLGVIQKPGAAGDPLTSELAGLDDHQRSRAQAYYAACAERMLGRLCLDSVGSEPKLRVSWAEQQGCAGSSEKVVALQTGDWETLHLDIAMGSGALRIDPLDGCGVIDFARIAIERGGKPTWQLTADNARALIIGGTAMKIPGDSLISVLSFGVSPQLLLPEVDGGLPGEGANVSLELIVRARTTLAETVSMLRDLLVSRDAALERYRAEDAAVKQSRVEADAVIQQCRAEASSLSRELADIRESLSWRLTAPLRSVAGAFGYRGAKIHTK